MSKRYAVEVVSIPTGEHIGWLQADGSCSEKQHDFLTTQRMVRAVKCYTQGYNWLNQSLSYAIQEV